MNYVSYFKKHLALILLISCIAGFGGLVFSLYQKGKFEATTRVLIVQKVDIAHIDAYTASKSAENISTLLSQIVYTNSFLDQVVTSNYFIEDKFGNSDADRSKEWAKTVSINPVRDTGILDISVYHQDKSQAEQIAHAITFLIVSNGTTYYGNEDLFKVRIIDQPSVSEKTVLPNIPQNVLFAALIASSGVVMFLILRYESGIRTIIRVPYIGSISASMRKRKEENIILRTYEDEEISRKLAEKLHANLATIDNN